MNNRSLRAVLALAIVVSAPIVYLGCVSQNAPGQTPAPVATPGAPSSTSSAMPSALPAPTAKP
jgi:hypothetical protein